MSSLFDAGPGVLGAGIGVVYNAKFYPEINNAVIEPSYPRVDGALYVKLSEKVSANPNASNCRRLEGRCEIRLPPHSALPARLNWLECAQYRYEAPSLTRCPHGSAEDFR